MNKTDILSGKIKKDFIVWLLYSTNENTHTFHKLDIKQQYSIIIEWLDTIGIYVGVFAGMYDTFNNNIQVKGTWKKWVSGPTYETRAEAYVELFKKVVELYNDGHLIQMPVVSGSSILNINKTESVVKFEPIIHEQKYIMGVDTYDKDALVYCLSRKLDDTFEILLTKKMRDENEFNKDVETLSRYFNADVIREGVFVPSNSKEIDIKYIDVPNICFSLTKEGDKREAEFTRQRIERGFDDSETWSLSGTLANFLLPRLIRFNELDCFKREKKYRKDMKNFISLLELEIRDNGERDFTDEEEITINKGLKAFKRIFFRLWW